MYRIVGILRCDVQHFSQQKTIQVRDGLDRDLFH